MSDWKSENSVAWSVRNFLSTLRTCCFLGDPARDRRRQLPVRDADPVAPAALMAGAKWQIL